MEKQKQRGEWRCVSMEGEGQCVTINGQIGILQWCAGTWDSMMTLEVDAQSIQ